MRLSLEFLEDEELGNELKDEIVEMEKIVASLLEAERLNSRHAKLNRSKVNVGSLVDELIDDFFGRDRDRIVVHRVDESITVDVDEARVSQMLKNLIANALQYSKAADGPVEVSYAVDDGDLVLQVWDHGPGLDDEQAVEAWRAFLSQRSIPRQELRRHWPGSVSGDPGCEGTWWKTCAESLRKTRRSFRDSTANKRSNDAVCKRM